MTFTNTAAEDFAESFYDLALQYSLEARQEAIECGKEADTETIEKEADERAAREFSTVYCTDNLINACTKSELSRALGISEQETEERGEVFERALEQYDRDYKNAFLKSLES